MTDRQGNSATMQGIRILQSWNCVLEDCKVAKIIDIAMLRCWEIAGKRRYQGGEQPPAVRKDGMLSNRQLAPGRAQNLLAGCIFVGVADKSAFALLSQKVTKAMRRIRRSLPDREKGKFIEADNQRYDRERLCQPQQQKIPRKEH